MATTKKVTKTSKETTKTSKPLSKSSKTAPKKSVIVSKKVIKGPVNKTPKSIPINHKVVYSKNTDNKETTKVNFASTPKPTSRVIESSVKTNENKPQVNVNPNPQNNNVVTNKPTQVVNPNPQQVNKTNAINQTQNNSNTQNNSVQPQANNTQNVKPQVIQSEVKPQKKKKRHIWVEVVASVLLFGGVLGGVGYHVYNLVSQTEKKEEFTRNVKSLSEDVYIAKKEKVNDSYFISLSTNDRTYEVDSVTEIKIGENTIDSKDYTFDKSMQRVKFEVAFLNGKTGDISIKTTASKITIINLSTPSKDIEEGKEFILEAELVYGKQDDELTFKSSDENIATVESVNYNEESKKYTCKVKAKSFSSEETKLSKTANITASTSVSGKKSSCTVKVSKEKVKATYEYHGYDINDQETTSEIDIKYYKLACTNTNDCEIAIIPATHSGSDGIARPVSGFYYKQEGYYYIGAFNNSKKLVSIEFEKPDNIKTLDNFAFYNCFSLKNFPLQSLSSLTSIGTKVFNLCYEFESLTIPSSVTSIGEQFIVIDESKSKLKSLTFEDKVNTKWNLIKSENDTTTYDTAGKSGEEILKDYLANSENTTWKKDIDFKLKLGFIKYDDNDIKEGEEGFTVASKCKVYCNNPIEERDLLTSVIIPEKYDGLPVVGVEGYIKENYCGFKDCEKLVDVTFEKPENIVSLDADAFFGCKSLKTINTQDCDIKIIGDRCFLGCFSLVNVNFPKIEIIGDEAFSYCTNLVGFNRDTSKDYNCVFPATTKRVGKYAFATIRKKGNQTELTKINFATYVKPDISSLAFGEYFSNKNLYTTDGNFYCINNFSDIGKQSYACCGFISEPSEEEIEIDLSTLNQYVRIICADFIYGNRRNHKIKTFNMNNSNIYFISCNAFPDDTNFTDNVKFTFGNGATYKINRLHYGKSNDVELVTNSFEPYVKSRSEIIRYLHSYGDGENFYHYQWIKN